MAFEPEYPAGYESTVVSGLQNCGEDSDLYMAKETVAAR